MPNAIEENLKKQETKRNVQVPMIILLGLIVVLVALVMFKPKALKEVPEPRLPVVSIQQVEKQTVSIPVYSRGIIKPGTEIPLVSEVQGKIVEVSKNFESGAYFKQGELLLKIDATNYTLDLARAKSQVANAKLNLAKVDAEVKTNRISASSVGKARLEEAHAQLEAAQADYTRAKLLLAGTSIIAPFDGRVREKLVDVAQYIAPGVQIGTIFATDMAELKLPLSDAQLELIKIPTQPGGSDAEQNPRIILRGEYAGHDYFWYGKVVRTEGGVNQRNRLLHVIAEIEQPFNEDESQPNKPPLMIGKFVEVEIEGTKFHDVVAIPREILRNSNQVWTLNDDNHLEIKQVEVMHRGKDKVYIRSGLEHGDWVVSTQLDVVVDGMKVQLADNQKVDRLPSLSPDAQEEQKNISPLADLLPVLGEENQPMEENAQAVGAAENKATTEAIEQQPLILQPESSTQDPVRALAQDQPAKQAGETITKENKTAKPFLSKQTSKPTSNNKLTTEIILRESKMPVSLLERE